MEFNRISDLIVYCEEQGISFSQAALAYEQEKTGETRQAILDQMEFNLQAMENSVSQGLGGVQSYSGFSGYDAVKLKHYRESGKSLVQGVFLDAITYAIAVNEVNAAMGVICATPTAGSAGVVPATLLAVRDRLGLDRLAQLNFLLTAGLTGMIIGNNASLSGASGGCQAEIGSASAMAAAALTEAQGASPEQVGHAIAIALKNILGLVCDPVAGLVEIPCIKRNALGASNALTASELALAGVESKIPCDDVIESMGRIGAMIPYALRETALGGLATSKSALEMARQLKAQKKAQIKQTETRNP